MFEDIPEILSVTEAANLVKRTDQRSIIVKQLIPNTSYRFRVRAINSFGRGKEASKPSCKRFLVEYLCVLILIYLIEIKIIHLLNFSFYF